MSKKIGILGSGIVGQVLSSGFLKHGDEVMIGTRDISKLNEWKSNNSKGAIGSFEETAKFGDIIVLAVKGSAAESTLKLAGTTNLEGKVEAARAIEPLCMLWCIPGFVRNEWNHAFKLLKS